MEKTSLLYPIIENSKGDFLESNFDQRVRTVELAHLIDTECRCQQTCGYRAIGIQGRNGSKAVTHIIQED